jgi:hypothetical protein
MMMQRSRTHHIGARCRTPYAASNRIRPHHARQHRAVCRFRGSSNDSDSSAEPQQPDASAPSSSSDPLEQRRLINQLLQVSSDQSIDLPLLDGPAPTGSSSSQQPQEQQPRSLFDDPVAAEYDPLLLDMRGFTSVREFLASQQAAAAGQAKVGLTVGIWGAVTAAVLAHLGGPEAYQLALLDVTNAGRAVGNLSAVWMGLCRYYTAKVSMRAQGMQPAARALVLCATATPSRRQCTCFKHVCAASAVCHGQGFVMSGVTAMRSWRLHAQQEELLDAIAEHVDVSRLLRGALGQEGLPRDPACHSSSRWWH